MCDRCAKDYFRQRADSPLTECKLCSTAAHGVSCGSNTTVATFNLTSGYWRHSVLTMETWRCKSNGDWTPCRGGADAGTDGDGYCQPGYRGPRCEICAGPAYSKYFDKLDFRCRDCDHITIQALVALATLLALASGLAGAAATTKRYRWCVESREKALALMHKGQKLWRKAGMRYKVKALVGVYQCVAAVPSVFDVTAPRGLEEYTWWMNILEIPADMGSIFIPNSCIGNFHTRLLVSSFWPVGLLLCAAFCLVSLELVKERTSAEAALTARGNLLAVNAGLQRTLPLVLVTTFVLVPSISMLTFKSFLCDSITVDDFESPAIVKRYLHADVLFLCDTDEYTNLQRVAIVMICIWPLGVPLLSAGWIRTLASNSDWTQCPTSLVSLRQLYRTALGVP